MRPQIIPDQAQCPACQIHVQRIRTLQSGVDSAHGVTSVVRVDSEGRYWVIRNNELPVIFDSAGRFLRVLGRKGQGPGEYLLPTDVLSVPPDSVVVLDGQQRRGTVLDKQLRVVRTLVLPLNVFSSVVVSWPSRIIGTGVASGPREAGWPLHELSFASGREGTITRSFGSGDGELRPDWGARTHHSITTPKDAMFWAAWAYGYVLTQFNLAGRPVRALARQPEWFREPSQPGIGTPTTPPPSRVADVAQDAQGFLWVFIRVPAKKWKAAWPSLPPGTREISTRRIAMQDLYDTVVEVIDARMARVVSRTMISGSYFVNTLPGMRAAMYDVDADGVEAVSIVSLALVVR
jgi:hypothetical protein